MKTPLVAAVFRAPRRPLELEALDLDPPGPGEVAVRMVASGVCHSDLHVVDGEWERLTDLVLGHDGAAVVEELGPNLAERPADAPLDAGGLRVGDLVVLSWIAPCGACRACRRGEAWLCARPIGGDHRVEPPAVRLRRPDGSPIGVYCGIGTFGERQVVAAGAAIPVDPATPPEIAALIGCAVTTGVGAATKTAAVRPGESVVVIGLGGVGLSVVMGAALAGADPIIAVDRVPEKLAVARLAGATHGLQAGGGPRPGVRAGRGVRAAAEGALSPEEIRATVRDLTGGGADHAFEAIGLTATVEQAVELVRLGGTVTLVGMTPQGQRAGIDVYDFVEQGKVLRGSTYGSAVPALDFPRIARLYLEDRLPLDLLVGERIGLEGIDSALAAMRRGEGLRRVVVY
ncbi:MAG: hypothetical protein A2X23_12615 [Chloroflexi bacterium GWC2_73_18]|nr:MAG: hypothetical protein A2X23_12615 [Chloroflexi bacterium GWC2_73_18]